MRSIIFFLKGYKMGKYYGKNVDYDAMLLDGSDEKDELRDSSGLCVICYYYSCGKCQHDDEAIRDWHESLTQESMVEAELDKIEEAANDI